MRDLNSIRESQKGMDIDELEVLVNSFTIQEKLAFSPRLTREVLADKIKDLRERQVPQRTVLLDMKDEDIVFYWLRNFIHPNLNHWIYPSSKDKRGCSEKVLERDAKIDRLYFYENGQFHYNYTMKDIEDYISGEV